MVAMLMMTSTISASSNLLRHTSPLQLVLPSLSIIQHSTNSLLPKLSFQCPSTNYYYYYAAKNKKSPYLHLSISSPPIGIAAVQNERCVIEEAVVDEEEEIRFTKQGSESDNNQEILEKKETLLYSIAPLPLFFFVAAAALPGASTVTSLFGPIAEIIKTLNLPDWLVQWGHPGNMAVVLFAMGGYGTYLGFRIKYSDDMEEKAKAKDLHPKLLAGMFFFFTLGATGGIISLLTTDKPIFESPHALTGLIGLALLTIQTLLPTKFEENPGLRNVHGILGSGIMTLFFVHAALGLQLGFSI